MANCVFSQLRFLVTVALTWRRCCHLTVGGVTSSRTLVLAPSELITPGNHFIMQREFS